MRSLPRLLALSAISALAACAHLTPDLKRVDGLIENGQWFTARERLDELSDKDAGNVEIQRRFEALKQAVAAQSENLDFNPIGYFYAEAYKDYFDNKRFLRASQAMQQILAYTLNNEEILAYMDKTQIQIADDVRRTKQEVDAILKKVSSLHASGRHQEAMRAAQSALALDPTSAQAQQWLKKLSERAPVLPAVAEPPAAPDAQWVESRYREALRVYILGDMAHARDILRELVAADSGNRRTQRTLDRIENELRRAAKPDQAK